jgi:hypothetical protein
MRTLLLTLALMLLPAFPTDQPAQRPAHNPADEPAHNPADEPDDVQPPARTIDLLADGSLRAWSFLSNDADAALGDVWTLRDGVLHGTGRPIGYLQTRRWYRDYEFELEWSWTPDGGGNSGVLVHTTAPLLFYGWPRSLEVQLQHGRAGDFWVIGKGVDIEVPNAAERRAAPRPGDAHSHRRIRRAVDTTERPLGEWNHMRIRARGDTITVEVNGTEVNRGTRCTEREGAIALQSEGTPIRFRNVRLRALPTRPGE